MITVVVDLPWVPATATSVPPLTAIPRASARLTTGSPRARAATSSGWSRGMAEVTTTACAPATCAGSWPRCTSMPARWRSSTPAGAASHPVTATPRRRNNSASALIPAPAMPTKCTGRRSAGSKGGIAPADPGGPGRRRHGAVRAMSAARRSAMRADASGRPRAAAAAAASASCAGDASSGANVAASRTTVASACGRPARGARRRQGTRVGGLVIGCRRRQRDEHHRDPPGAEFGRGHRARARDREVGRRVRLRDRREVGAHPHALALARREAIEVRPPRRPEHGDPGRQPVADPGIHERVEGARSPGSRRTRGSRAARRARSPRPVARSGAVRPRRRGRLDRVAGVERPGARRRRAAPRRLPGSPRTPRAPSGRTAARCARATSSAPGLQMECVAARPSPAWHPTRSPRSPRRGAGGRCGRGPPRGARRTGGRAACASCATARPGTSGGGRAAGAGSRWWAARRARCRAWRR